MQADFPLWLQQVLVALAVTVSALVVLHVQAPGLMRRVRVALAAPLVRDGRPRWQREVGRRIAPPLPGDSGCGRCGGGCTPKR